MKQIRISAICVIAILFCGYVYKPVLVNIGMLAFVDYLATPSSAANDWRLIWANQIFIMPFNAREVKMKDYQLRVQGLLERNRSSEYQTYQTGRMFLQEGDRLASRSDRYVAAISSYNEAISSGTEQVQLEAYLGLARLFRINDNAHAFETTMVKTLSLSLPSWQCPSAFTDKTLLGGYIDIHDLALQRPVHLAMVWQITPEFASKLSWREFPFESGNFHFYVWGEQLYQVGTAVNLIPDGGFEAAILPREGNFLQLPIGLCNGACHCRLTARERSMNIENLILEIEGQEQTISGLSTESLPVVVDSCGSYVLTGEYRTAPSSRPLIGIRWLLEDSQAWDDNISTYIVTQPTPEWTTFSGILQAPQGASALQVWILNINSVGNLQIDNLGLFLVPLPCLFMVQ